MKRLLIAGFSAILGLAPLASGAGTVNVNTLYSFGFDGIGSSIIGTDGGSFTDCTNPNCTESPIGTSFEFTLTKAGVLTVLDLFLSVDQFQIFDSTLGLLGLTSAPIDGGACGSDFSCSLADASYSRGVFNLAAGTYSISGIQIAGIGGAGAFIVQTSAVPLPAALPLLALGLGGLAAIRRRRKSV